MGVHGRRAAVGLVVAVLTVGLAGCSASPGPADAAPRSPTPAGTSPAPSAPITPPSATVTATPGPGTSAPVTDGPTVPQSPPPPTNYPDADTLAPATATTGLPTIDVRDLPAQAVRTLQLIKDGGPFPFPRDGLMFQNRERHLPGRPFGFYHEYTVVTPGAADRGGRRIVTGADGSRFWTTDHYESFQEVIAPWS